jgi:hypothetical protein
VGTDRPVVRGALERAGIRGWRRANGTGKDKARGGFVAANASWMLCPSGMPFHTALIHYTGQSYDLL